MIAPSRKLCCCDDREPQFSSGLWHCGTCGQLVPDPRDAVLLAAIKRHIDRRLAPLLEQAPAEPDETQLDPGAPYGEWIDANEKARRLGKTREYVYRHKWELGGKRLPGGPKDRGRLVFPPDLDGPTTQPEAQGKAEPAKPRRPRSSSGAVELLPIGPKRRGHAA